MLWSICLALAVLSAPSQSESEPDKRFLLDTIGHAVDTVGHILTDTAHSIGNAAGNVVGTLGNAAGTVLGAAGGLVAGVVTTGADLLIHKVDFMSKAAVDVLNGGLDLVTGVVHGISDIIDGILGHCFFFCWHHHGSRPVHPIIKCPASISVTAEPKSTSKVISLSRPVYSDPRGLSLKLTAYNLPGGNTFPEGSTTVRFTATNSRGLSSSCLVTVTVKVKRCSQPSYIENGQASCITSDRYILLGDSCTFTCEAGYTRTGPATTVCTDSGQMKSPICSALSCGAPPLLSRGNYVCPLGQFVFESVCHLTCPKGFSAAGNIHITCPATQRWSLPGQCVATSPPSFLHLNCSDSVTYTPVSGTLTAKVIWDQVKVDPTTGAGQVTVTQTVGPRPGSLIGPGRQTVGYEAVDETGYKASCYFTVDAARELKPCIPPSYSIKDDGLRFDCPNGFSLGSTCTVRCKPGYHSVPPVDDSTIKCSLDSSVQLGSDWKFSAPPITCQSRACASLVPPDNGALSCDKWVSGNMCQIQCQDGYILPLSAPPNGMYACGGQSGSWRPNSYVYPCVGSTLPLSFRAPGNIYYSGSCPSSSAARAQIRDNFIKTLTNSIFMSACSDQSQCNAQNVDVICGKVTGKRQASFAVQIKFDVVIPYNTANGVGMAAVMTAQGLMNKIAADITSAIKAGHFSFPSSGLSAITGVLHVDAIAMVCPSGTAAVYTSGACAGCPKGQYYNATTSTCMDAPKGYYQPTDNSVTYTACPSGKSTVSTGAKDLSECTELCPPGQYSPTGLSPCSVCQKGSYTRHPGQVKCTVCAVGYTTADVAATTGVSCVDLRRSLYQCRSSPCANNGVCEDDSNGYNCKCPDGYTGEHCEIAPSFCIHRPCNNGATCDSNNTSYTCLCTSGYAGKNCELKIVNGGWGSWSTWSGCTATCGQNGRQWRSRKCDSPAPKNGGTKCSGDATQTLPCNQITCPVCSVFPHSPNTIVQCNKAGVTQTCNITCVAGYSFTNSPLPTYECGPGTMFKWSYETQTSGFLPSCTEMSVPKSLNVKSTLSFSGLKCSLVGSSGTYNQQLAQEIEQHSSKLACKDGGLCTTRTEVKCTTPLTDAVVELTLTSSAPSKSNLDLKNYFQNKQVSPELALYLQTLLAMELTGSQLENHTSSLMSVTVNNIRYTAVSQGVVSGVECHSGAVYRGSTCVKCSPGTIQVNNECHLCEVSTYQPLEGQGQCQKCPQGLITLYTGTVSVQDCIASSKPTVSYVMVTPLPVQVLTQVIQIGKRG